MRWLVEIAPAFRQDVGAFEDVGADSVAIESGCLVFRTDGEPNYIRAAGTWITCVPSED